MKSNHKLLSFVVVALFLCILTIVLPLSSIAYAAEGSLSNNTYTIFNKDNDVNGFYYVVEDGGAREIVYCYIKNKTQPSINGTSGYKKYDYFSSDVSCLTTESKKEVAALLYAAYGNDKCGFMSIFGTSEEYARSITQQNIWSLTRGDKLGYLSPTNYDYALFNYAQNGGSYGYTGNINIEGNTTLQKYGGLWKTGILTVGGTYTGMFSFDSLPTGFEIYNATTDSKITSPLSLGDKFYITYNGEISGSLKKDLTYSYETSNVYYYKAADSDYQDLISLKVSNTTGALSVAGEAESYTTRTVTKVWDDNNNQDGIRPSSIKVQLYANGTASGTPVTLTSADNWTYTWTNLLEKQNGTAITYTVKEVDAVSGYTTNYSEDTFTITSSHTPSKLVTEVVTDNKDEAVKETEPTLDTTSSSSVDTVTTTNNNTSEPVSKPVTEVVTDSKNEAVKETEPILGATASYGGDSVTAINSHTPETVSKPVTEVLNDSNNKTVKEETEPILGTTSSASVDTVIATNNNTAEPVSKPITKVLNDKNNQTIKEIKPTLGATASSRGDTKHTVTNTKSIVPQTGDSTNIFLWIILLIGSLLGIFITIIVGYKKSYNGKY